MATPSKITRFLIGLSLLAAAAVGALVFVTLRASRPEPLPVLAIGQKPAIPSVLAYAPMPIGAAVEGHPIITHVVLADLDQDGLLDVLVCDASANRIGWIRQFPRGEFMEAPIGDSIPAPGRLTVCDLNQDGRPEVLVAGMGTLLPTDDRIGQVVVLENLGAEGFRHRVIEGRIQRVTDVRGTDVNSDGRIDLVVAQSGGLDGGVVWLENLGDWEFRRQVVASAPGIAAAAVADFDRDGTVDFAIAALPAREEIRLLTGIAGGESREVAVWQAARESWGSSGLETCDLNRDGRPDLVYTNGTSFNPSFPEPAVWHGLQWLENRGGTFDYHRIGTMPGCHSPVAVDLDGDGDIDLVTVSAVNHAIDPDTVSLTAWLNDGRENFTPVALARDPARMMSVAVGDLDGNGVPVLVTGASHVYPPFARMGRVTLWRRR